MSNILDAFVTLKQITTLILGDGTKGNSIQLVGGGLEGFIIDLFAGTIGQEVDQATKLKRVNEVFSYLGTSNQPPDAILKNGDAVEVKKVDSLNGAIQLNSSSPKSKLLASDTRINNKCRALAKKEGWKQKDIFYSVGSQSGGVLRRLWFVYGDCYAASHDVYDSISRRASQAIAGDFVDTTLSDTNEIAGVPNVDPLKITNLRVRGMWIIKNPSVVFSDYIQQSDAEFKAYCIMREDKYLTFPEQSRKNFEHNLDISLSVRKIDISDPDNPAEIIKARLIIYER